MIKIVKKAKDGVTLKYPNGKSFFHTWENFNKYFTVGEKNEAVLKEDNERVAKANSILEEAIQIAVERLTTNNTSLMEQINNKIDEIMKLTEAPEEKRKLVKHLIWREANAKTAPQRMTTIGDVVSAQLKNKLNKGN